MRTAVYNGTRNVYGSIRIALNSLLVNGGADRIYVLAEDDSLPYPVPDHVRVINVINQNWILRSSPSYFCHWSYMVLMRACLSKILPNEDNVLSLDIDTIVDGDISELWDTDLSGYYLAAAKEADKSSAGDPYYQMGVVLFNLRQIREDGIDDKLIEALNTKHYGFAEQDAVNEICKGKIKEMSSRFNANRFTGYPEDIRIYHFAGEGEKNWHKKPIARKYS